MTGEAPSPTPRRPRGCLLWTGIVAAALIALTVLLAAFFGGGDGGGSATGFDAGQADLYEPGSVTSIEGRRLLITRLPDGSFLAFYALSSRQQELLGDCELVYDETAGTGTLPQVQGMVGAIVEDCGDSRSVWRADGEPAFGISGAYGPLDRYETSVDDAGHLIVDTSSRSCTRSRGVIGVPPFDPKRC